MYHHIKTGQFFKQVRHKTYKYIVIYVSLCLFYIIAQKSYGMNGLFVAL
jgi:hypothetical protein